MNFGSSVIDLNIFEKDLNKDQGSQDIWTKIQNEPYVQDQIAAPASNIVYDDQIRTMTATGSQVQADRANAVVALADSQAQIAEALLYHAQQKQKLVKFGLMAASALLLIAIIKRK